MAHRFVSIKPVQLNGWIVQGSILANDVMCLVLHHTITSNTIVRYFHDEVQAHLFLSDVVYGGYEQSEEE